MTRIVALVAAALALLLAGGCSLLGVPDGASFEVELVRANNVFAGSPVRVLGVDVGTVVAVESPSDRRGAVASIRLDRGRQLPADVTAHVVQGSLLGERFIELDPPYTDGPQLADGAVIPLERTGVPAEFDEVLASLDRFLTALPPEEVDRFVRNAATTLESRGDDLGRTLETTAAAVAALAENDEELVDLVTGVADLSEALGSRDAELRGLLTDYASLAGTLADERDAVDATLAEVARLTVAVGDLLEEHGERLGADVEVLARLGRTLERNRGEIERLVRGQADLFETAERVFDRERNWLPLVNHSSDLPRLVEERLAARFAGLCARIGRDDCADVAFWSSELPVGVCLDPLFPCELPDDEDAELIGLGEALERAIDEVPELADAARSSREEQPAPEGPPPGIVERALDGVAGWLAGEEDA